jgi:uncharacterized protein YihD (DUF1040 family)
MVEEYLKNQLKETGWHFISLVKLLNDLKQHKPVEDIRSDLNKLFIENKIAKRAGINGDLIEIIDKNI